ncbi:MAG: permease [Anaerolineales bacterium]|nr:permease [Anaerolineales bacterium]
MDKNSASTNNLGLFVGGLALLTAAAVILTAAVPQAIATTTAAWGQHVLTVFINTLPFLVLGSLTAGFLEQFLTPQTITNQLPRSPRGRLLAAALLGLVFPFGTVGIVPIAWVLHKKGLPASLGVTFLLAAPAVNPISFLATATTLGWGWALFHLTAALLIAFCVGALANRLPLLASFHPAPPPNLAQPTSFTLRTFWSAVSQGSDLLLHFLAYFVVGCLLAAVWQTTPLTTTLIGTNQSTLTSMIAILPITFFAGTSSLTASTATAAWSAGVTAIYLTLGTMLGITTVTTLTAVLKPRSLALLLAIITFFSLLSGLLVTIFN